ncbi:hypothetical protein BGX34_005042 [Mortierella sp. NVP85]|nr:hypothetical protein BGX34_005042 [Mortierella sp. NVP85]
MMRQVTDEDLLSLLTVYAPFLVTLSVDRLHSRSLFNGYRFLKTAMKADQSNHAYVERTLASWQSQCGQDEVGHDGDTDGKTKSASPLVGQAL